ncbi:MAG: hypothetical protein PW792_08810 [Acidobacteriaceae bacterium]|nr:hypothetical protein [Acidobacteriaceae bacterium]
MTSETGASPKTGTTDFTAATNIAEAAKILAEQAAARAEEARSRAAEAAAKLTALRTQAIEADAAEDAAEATIPQPLAQEEATKLVETVLQQGPVLPAGIVVDPPPAETRPIAAQPEPITSTTRLADGRRASEMKDMPSGVVRLANSLRAQRSDRATKRRKVKRKAPARKPGALLEPVAHEAGLFSPAKAKKRKIITPRLVLLFLLMIFFGLYATGNFPQFDRWTDHLVSATQSHNDDVVGAFTNHWHGAAYVICALLLGGILFIVRQNRERAE